MLPAQKLWYCVSSLQWIVHLALLTQAHSSGTHPKGNHPDNSVPTSTAPPQLPSLLRARPQSPSDWTDRRVDNGGILDRPTTTCCYNGGLCVMGVFCHCSEKYYGFRCEHERVSCGPVQHDQWARLGCNLCRCFDARLHCLANVYSGCEGKPVDEDIRAEEYLDDMEIYPMDEEPSVDIDAYNTDDYYYYWDDGDQVDYVDKSGSGQNHRTSGRGKSRSKGGHSASSVQTWPPCLILLSLCGLVTVLTRSVQLVSQDRKEIFFVS
ncbi:hypothetical protein EGW08_013190 [Elysia chlorotica]|uniref:EGF-like domain-containing protein n=1 Tax=Elysia chlorotica TaxID=188477 RepID=A0A3S0ZZK8_ELYCH|nr:hypothetical protein EGW08_013190 [Elysia chlorotica]